LRPVHQQGASTIIHQEIRMSRPVRLLAGDRRQLAVVASLVFASFVCLLLLLVRALYAGYLSHQGLAWNLFLAWMPMVSALLVYNLSKTRRRVAWLLIVPFVAFWLLFFPNAPYVLTDILHLRPKPVVPLWYDLILLIAFAWTGTFLGLVSLYLMQGLVQRLAGARTGWLFTLGVLAAGGFGVYLGRFPRYNSWDAILNPATLAYDILSHLRHPLAHPRTYIFSALFSLCLTAIYLMLVAVIHLRPETQDS
jgi:uncharacterized membrane protein